MPARLKSCSLRWKACEAWCSLRIDRSLGYFGYVWRAVHTLTAADLSQSSPPSSGSDDVKKFELYLEAEESRLENNLRAVDYIIDSIDTIPLIAGVGRIEKVRLGIHISRIWTHLCCRPSSRCCTCS